MSVVNATYPAKDTEHKKVLYHLSAKIQTVICKIAHLEIIVAMVLTGEPYYAYNTVKAY